jgi:hypothetical protein
VPDYDLESMEMVAGKIAAIHDRFQDSKKKLTGVPPKHPFGAVRHPEEDPEHPNHAIPSRSDDAAGAVHSFSQGSQTEFEAGGRLMSATGDALRRAIQLIREREAAAKDSVTVKDQGAVDL